MSEKSKIKIKDVNNNISNRSRDEKIKILLDYARECYKNSHKPTKKEIRKKFHLEIYNYFKNIADYHKKAGIKVSLRNYPKEKAREVLINYIKQEAKVSHFPTFRELEKRFRVHFTTYFKNLKELYKNANVNYSLVEKAIKNKILIANTHSEHKLNRQKRLIKEFIQENVVRGIYPGVRRIQKNLNLSFYNLYNNIFEAYKNAGVKYERPSPILLGKKKEEVFTNIVTELLIKMGFKIKRVSIKSKINFNNYADMTIEDKNGRLYLVEIKAYRKDYCITKREFGQLLKYLKKERISTGMLITTSNSKRCDFDNIHFINGDKVIELLKMYELTQYIKLIEWIQESRVNSKEREKYKKTMKKKILNYITIGECIPTKREIEKTFRIDLRSIFGEIRPYEKLLKEIKKSGAFPP